LRLTGKEPHVSLRSLLVPARPFFGRTPGPHTPGACMPPLPSQREEGEKVRSPTTEIRRSGLSRSPEKRCSEVDHAAARVGEEVAAAAGVKVRSVTGKSAPPRRSGRHG